MKFLLAVASAAACSWRAQATAVTPVEKVIELLGKLQVQVEQEGKEEAAAYDKYACFCKEQVDEKLYAITKSKEKIEKLDAKIEKLSAEITSLDGEISDLGKEIDGLTEKMKVAKEKRTGEHAIFVENLADVDGAISACDRALESLKTSKSDLGGKVELEALAQIQAVARTILGTDLAIVVAQPGKAHEYKYHANDIIATIEALQKKFTQKKNELEQEEFDTNSDFEKRQLNFANEKKFAEKEKMEKETLAEEKREQKGLAEADRTQEINEKNADQGYLDVLTEECETKANLWDQRSQTRADEIKALSEAMTALKEGVAPNYKANKKLVGLQKSVSAEHRAHWVYKGEVVKTKPATKALSFLQLRGNGKARGSLSKKVSEMLMTSARDLKSPILSMAALKISLSEDHFVKVRQIIKDLVAKLESEAEAEKTQKGFCDEQMKLAITSRDEEQGKVETLKAKITGKEADKAQLKQEIAQLSKEIAENKRALMEATELREKESQENLLTIEEAGAGKEAVAHAVEVLKTFYGGAAFVQKASFVPTNSDREGKTVADRAPEVFDEDYKGSQEASKGIIGMLEVIKSDFDRTDTSTEAAEKRAHEEFVEFDRTSKTDISGKETRIQLDTEDVLTTENTIVQKMEDLKTAQELLDGALKRIEDLTPTCVDTGMSFEARVAKREEEVVALKNALCILDAEGVEADCQGQ